MKIQAKDIQVGMLIQWGVVKLTVERIVPFTQKNGKTGKFFYGPGERSLGKGFKPIRLDNGEINAKDETFLTVL